MRPTIVDIAKRAGVSIKTVSRVMNDGAHVSVELRDRVRAVMAELDYRPNLAARTLKSRRGFMIAMLMTEELAAFMRDEEQIFPFFIASIQNSALVACQQMDYRFAIEIADLRAPDLAAVLPENLRRAGIDGLILVPPICDDLALLDILDAGAISYVRVAPGIELKRGASVAIDEFGAALAMVGRLIALGHRRIGCISGPADHVAAAARLVAYRQALAACDDAAQPMTVSGDFSFRSGAAAAETLLSRPDRPTAVFAANDDMAAGALATAGRLGLRVPEDLSIAGFDNSAVSRITWPPLTTVHQPIAEMTAAAVRHLVARAGEATLQPEQFILPYTLIERGSTAALSAHAPRA